MMALMEAWNQYQILEANQSYEYISMMACNKYQIFDATQIYEYLSIMALMLVCNQYQILDATQKYEYIGNSVIRQFGTVQNVQVFSFCSCN